MTAKQRETEASALSSRLDRRIEQIDQVNEPVRCNVSGKVLAKKLRAGLWLWCKDRDCHGWQFFSWEELGVK